MANDGLTTLSNRDILHRHFLVHAAVVAIECVVLSGVGARELVYGAREIFPSRDGFGSSQVSAEFQQCRMDRTHLRQQHDVELVFGFLPFDDR